MILASAWNLKFLWQREQLQRIYYNTTEAGEEMFVRLNALGMLQRSVREVYYFRLGLRFPLAEFFANWVEKGYPGPSQKTKPPLGSRVAEPSGTGNMSGVYRQPERNICVTVNNKHIRRLWARGAKKKEIVCGFLRDSIDSIGRPFPLLIIGEGNLDSWEENLDLLPCVCERTWSRLEYISMKNIFELKQFERGIFNTAPPCSDWADAGRSLREARCIPCKDEQLPAYFNTKRCNILPLTRCDDYEMFHIYMDFPGNKIKSVARTHYMLKEGSMGTPHAVFVGGSFYKTYVVCFKRPLLHEDFSILWSLLEA